MPRVQQESTKWKRRHLMVTYAVNNSENSAKKISFHLNAQVFSTPNGGSNGRKHHRLQMVAGSFSVGEPGNLSARNDDALCGGTDNEGAKRTLIQNGALWHFGETRLSRSPAARRVRAHQFRAAFYFSVRCGQGPTRRKGELMQKGSLRGSEPFLCPIATNSPNFPFLRSGRRRACERDSSEELPNSASKLPSSLAELGNFAGKIGISFSDLPISPEEIHKSAGEICISFLHLGSENLLFPKSTSAPVVRRLRLTRSR